MADKKNGVEKLNEEFDQSSTFYHRINCEKRTNLNLFLGHHFLKTSDEVNRRLDKRGIDKGSRIRVTANHIFKICEYIKNAILSAGADHDVFPENPDELQDVKSAELHRSVLSKWKHVNNYKNLARCLAGDYVVDGEVAVKTFWDPNKGEVIGKQIVINEQTGEQEEKLIKTGEAVVERIFAWDLIFPENVKTVESAPWIGYQKMMPTKTLKDSVAPEIRDRIEDSSDRTFEIFDPTTGNYNHRKGMTLVREKYTKPCKKYPTGYFQIFNEDLVIHEGPLPEGHPFPIKVKGFTEVPTSPRSVSIIRQLRPLQMNVNFCLSQEILTMMTVGHDKLIMLGGADLQHSGSHKGIEKYKTSSLQSPVYLPGRSGSQFVDGAVRSVQTMYQLANVPDLEAEKATKTDPIGSLFNSVKDKRRFILYTEKFTEFMQEILEDVLTLKKIYMNPEEIVKVVGRSERVNISEFKNAEKIGYQIRVNEVDENETQLMGKHIELTNMLQYGSGKLTDEMVALIGRNMPFLNQEEIFEEALIDYDTSKNTILKLDRGQMVDPSRVSNPDYMLKKIHNRTMKADFEYLDEQIQMNYSNYIAALEQVKAQQLQALKMQQSQLIPTSGAMVPIQIYREVPKADGGVKYERIQVPYDSLQDLVNKLEAQGATLDPMQRLEQSTQANIAQILNMQGQQVQA